MDTEGCPSPRVGHASLTLGNAFIVFGGDTKIEETDILDDNLYLLNTTSLKWTVAAPVGHRPSGRYGHTISTIGSVLYVFGGQLDDTFFNDLVSFDLTTLQNPDSSWNVIKPNSKVPPPRTNHTIVTYQDKLYLFGGTDGKLWYSDTWVYDPVTNEWEALQCAGFIPAPCEGHSATIVDDTMYIFGGRSSEGKDLGILSALKIPTKKWFSFQNMGPGPTPRSGHSMTAFGGNKILIMGGESPDLGANPETVTYDGDSNNVVYVLDTSRISYPPNASEPATKGGEARQMVAAPHNALESNVSAPPSYTENSAPGLVEKSAVPPPTEDSSPKPPVPEKPYLEDAAALAGSSASDKGNVTEEKALSPEPKLKALRTESSLSELTPGYGYERVNVGDPNPSEDETPAANERDIDAPAVVPVSPATNGASKSQETGSPFSVDTVRVDDTTTPTGTTSEVPPENLNQALEQLKASNTWYESELAAAREKGFIPSTRPPVDVLKMRRVSQRITMDTDHSLSERAILVEALSDLKEELHEVQQNIQHQAEQASAKIAAAEADRDDAFERLKLSETQQSESVTRGISSADGAEGDEKDRLIASLQSQLEEHSKTRAMFLGMRADDGDYNPLVELDKVRSDNVNLEQQLREFSDKNVLAQHEASRYKAQLDELKERHRVLEDTTDSHVKGLAAAAAAISAAQTKSSEYSNLLAVRNNERTTMQNELTSLRAELETAKQQLNDSNQQLEEHKQLLSRSAEQGSTSATALGDGIQNIVSIWGASKLFRKPSTKSKRLSVSSRSRDSTSDAETAAEEEDDDSEVAVLRRQLQEVTKLYETHQQASNDAAQELSATLQQVSSLKQELVATETSRQTSHAQLQKALSDLETHQTQLDENKRSLDDLETVRQETNEKADLVERLRKQLEENEEKYAALENEYESSVQYVRTSEKALTVTRDELNKFKDSNTKLQGELDQLRLRLQDQEDNDDASSVTSSNAGGVRSRSDRVGTPPAKYNSRQIDLQLRDLRAQIIILQEERDDLRASTLEVKKKLITNTEDLKDAQAMIEQLERENDELVKRAEAAEAALHSHASNGVPTGEPAPGSYSPEDPDKTLDSLTSELDQMRTARERFSGMLHG